MTEQRNPYGYATNEYWDFEAKKAGYKTPQAWLQATESKSFADKQEYDDWDHTETYDYD